MLEKLRVAKLNFGERDQSDSRHTTEGLLNGTLWVLTGTLSIPREEAEALIRSLGGRVSGTVSTKTSYLLAGDDSGSKLAKAEKLGVKILDEEGFRKLIS